MSRSAQDFQAELLALLPPGSAFTRDPASVLGRLMLAFGDGFADLDEAAELLLDEADPRKTNYLLPDWERVAGLPDPCAGPAPTLQARRAQLVARLTMQGGQSIPYIVGYAAALGYQISIAEHKPFRMGSGRMGDALGGEQWAYVWTVVAPQSTLQFFRMGQSAMGEPLRSWGNAVLECAIREICPAHTLVTFSYVPPVDLDLGNSQVDALPIAALFGA